MYTQFFGFTEKPFNVTPDPKFLYLTASHREALASMIYGITERRGYVSITGEVGTGKTTLIYSLLNQLSDKVRPVCIFHTTLSFEELLRTLLTELKIPPGDGNKTELLHQFNQYLHERLAEDEIIALIIDEAQNVSAEVLEEIRLLSNLETEKAKLLQIVFVGQPELEKKLDSDQLRQLWQRIVMRRTIAPLPEKEIQEYIEHRLKLVGSSTAAVFTTEALSLICRYSRGIPRTINTICDNAFLIGYGLAHKKIDAHIILEVLHDMDSTFIWQPEQSPEMTKEVRTISPPAHFFASPAFKKVAVGVLIVCFLWLIGLLGREFTRKSRPGTSIPMTKEVYRQKQVPPLPDSSVSASTAPSAPLAPAPESQPAPAAEALSTPEQTVTVPAPAETSKPAVRTAPQAQSIAAAPAAPAETDTETKAQTTVQPTAGVQKQETKQEAITTARQAAAEAPAQTVSKAAAYDTAFKPNLKTKKVARIQKGDTVYSLARQYFNSDTRTIIDLLLAANPQVKNPEIIKPGERFKIPEINESTIIMAAGENKYKIFVATYANPATAAAYKNEPVLKEYSVIVVPYTASTGQVFHRVFAGTFDSRYACIPVMKQLKAKNLLPALAPAPAKP
jgi:general secretion pathway protein A